MIDPAKFEALACREALSLAEKFLLQRLVVASDYESEVTEIDKRASRPYSAVVSHQSRR